MSISPDIQSLSNNLWVLFASLLVFLMTIAVGLLEAGELGPEMKSIGGHKTVMISATALFFMAFLGFNIAFAPTLGGIIGNPIYTSPFLGMFSPNTPGLLNDVWWSMTSSYFNTGLTLGSYYIFEAAFASVTMALVGVIGLKKVKFEAFFLYCIPYFILIWALPAAWIWNPTGWLYQMGMRDFAGGLVVHGAAAAAGLGIIAQIWREEKKKGLKESPQVRLSTSPNWLTLSILLLWIGWFGFNPGSVLALNSAAETVVITTFLCAASSFISIMFIKYVITRQNPGMVYADNGILMGLIIITPLAGFVSPGSAMILGLIGGPLFLAGEKFFQKFKWFSDPIGLFPGHLLGGLFGISMIAFFTQKAFANAAGFPTLPDGLFFGGGFDALRQLGIELIGVVAVMTIVFILSYISIRAISGAIHGITVEYRKEKLIQQEKPL